MGADPRDLRIAELEAENAALRAEVERLRRIIDDLTKRLKVQDVRLEELERAAHRQAAPFRRAEQKRKPPETHKRIGRPVGHAGQCRPRPDHVDEHVVERFPRDADGRACCPTCVARLARVSGVTQWIEDLPPPRVHVTQLDTERGVCPRCGRVATTHPRQVSVAGGAAGVHLGARALGLAATLRHHGLTSRKVCRVLQDLGGLRLSAGGLMQALQRVARRAGGALAGLYERLRKASFAHVDETSWYLRGTSWLWVFTSGDTTLYRVAPTRGRDVVLETLGPEFNGVVVSDCLSSYENLPYRMHKCYAHHLRAIARARDREPPENHAPFHELKGVLKAAMMLKATQEGLPPGNAAQARAGLERNIAALLQPQADAAEKVRERLRKRQSHLLTFLDVPEVDATNNAAERALHPAVIARKLSCGNKTPAGARAWETLASLYATCAQRAQPLADFLLPHLTLAPAR